jgi:BCD family chlorophyll transporter-like MFS transporter
MLQQTPPQTTPATVQQTFQTARQQAMQSWFELLPRLLPFADAATAELPMSRLLRLSLFQVSVGMAGALLTGTLNRVMIVELGVAAWLVALMVSLPMLFAPLRALIGFRSDTHRSALGWRRLPYLWFGTMLQFGGLAIMPFALLVLSGRGVGPIAVGQAGAALAFLLVGAGMHTTQTAGLALAADLAPERVRPRVIALLYVMLLVGLLTGGLLLGTLLADAGPLRLIQVVQGTALATLLLNVVAAWKQEVRGPATHRDPSPRPSFSAAWKSFADRTGARRFLVAVGLGTAAFSMQDILLEPYGGEILHLGLGATSGLTALLAMGTLIAFGLSARQLSRQADPYRLAALGAFIGLFAFAAVIFAAPTDSAALFCMGTFAVGVGGGLFSIGTLSAAMGLEQAHSRGLVLGAWGAAQATAAGLGIAVGGALRDITAMLAQSGTLGTVLTDPATGYAVVYQLEIGLLFMTLIALGPLVKIRQSDPSPKHAFGLAEFPS